MTTGMEQRQSKHKHEICEGWLDKWIEEKPKNMGEEKQAEQ